MGIDNFTSNEPKMIEEPNCTQIPNVFLDDWMNLLSADSFVILMAICRNTYGWNSRTNLLELEEISRATRMSRSDLINALEDLLEWQLIREYVDSDVRQEIRSYLLTPYSPDFPCTDKGRS